MLAWNFITFMYMYVTNEVTTYITLFQLCFTIAAVFTLILFFYMLFVVRWNLS